MCNLPYFVEAKVLEGDNYRGKIVDTIRVPARLTPDGRQVVYPKNRPNGLHPGVYTGDMVPILKRSDVV